MTKFLAEVVYCSNYVLNLVPTRDVADMIPPKKWNGIKPFVGHLRTFGCFDWVHINDNCRKKFDEKRHAYIMMGYFDE